MRPPCADAALSMPCRLKRSRLAAVPRPRGSSRSSQKERAPARRAPRSRSRRLPHVPSSRSEQSLFSSSIACRAAVNAASRCGGRATTTTRCRRSLRSPIAVMHGDAERAVLATRRLSRSRASSLRPSRRTPRTRDVSCACPGSGSAPFRGTRPPRRTRHRGQRERVVDGERRVDMTDAIGASVRRVAATETGGIRAISSAIRQRLVDPDVFAVACDDHLRGPRRWADALRRPRRSRRARSRPAAAPAEGASGPPPRDIEANKRTSTAHATSRTRRCENRQNHGHERAGRIRRHPASGPRERVLRGG